MPPKKNFVRGISYLTGYYIVSMRDSKDKDGCQVTYMTHSDPRGLCDVLCASLSGVNASSRLGDEVPKGMGSREGVVPPPQKILCFVILKWHILLNTEVLN